MVSYPYYFLGLDSQPQAAPASLVLVMWSCLLPLFLKCRTAGCNSVVLKDDIETSQDGRNIC